jgi:hypothetical protein
MPTPNGLEALAADLAARSPTVVMGALLISAGRAIGGLVAARKI